MKIFFPEFYTEAHRTPDAGQGLVAALGRVGVECVPVPGADCDLTFCGGYLRYRQAMTEYRRFPTVPVVHYCWDLYPWKVEGDPEDYQTVWWREYVAELKACRKVLVPSACTADSVRQYTGRDATVAKTSIRPWDPPPRERLSHLNLPEQETYALNVMRRYEADPNVGVLSMVCRDLEILLEEPEGQLDWDHFRALVVGARVLVSPYWEASTGGLTLLEGYWHGIPVLVADSHRNGARDYFGNRADYFQWDSWIDLGRKLEAHFACPPRIDVHEARDWITREYSEDAFAVRLKVTFEEAIA